MLLNCGVEEDSWESLGLQGDPTSHPKGNQSWVFIGRTDIKAETPILWLPDAKELTHLKRPWCWEQLKAGVEGDDRGCDDWRASLTQWAWVWVNSGSWWWIGRPGMLQIMGSQRVGHNWVTELNWTEWFGYSVCNLENNQTVRLRITILMTVYSEILLLLLTKGSGTFMKILAIRLWWYHL